MERIFQSASERNENFCIFCSIIGGHSEASVVEKDEQLHVIISLEGTPLIIPNKHIESPDEDPELSQKVFSKAIELIPAVKSVFKTQDFNILSNTGKFAGQEIQHFHTHILPRYESDKALRFSVANPMPRSKLDNIAESLANAKKNYI